MVSNSGYPFIYVLYIHTHTNTYTHINIYIYKINIIPNQPFKFTTKNWVEINDDANETYNTNSQIKFKATML